MRQELSEKKHVKDLWGDAAGHRKGPPTLVLGLGLGGPLR